MPIPIILLAIGGAATGLAIAELMKPKGKDDEILHENRSGERGDGSGDLPRSPTEISGDGGVKPSSTTEPKPKSKAKKKAEKDDAELPSENSGLNSPDISGDPSDPATQGSGDGGSE